MKEIPLSKGMVALVDDEDFERVNQFKWCAHKGRNTWYALRKIRGSGQVGPGRFQLLHNFIMGEMGIDHRNGSGLDCQKQNLRSATNAQNLRNRGKQSNNTSGFKGVARWHDGRWQVGIKIDGKRRHLGLVANPEDGARLYDAAALAAFGAFARLNFEGIETP